MIIGESWSEWQHRTVKVHYVGSKQGCWPSIVDAVTHASPGDRIEIGTGTYTEAIVISRPVELVNAEGEHPEISQWGTAITLCSAQGAYLCGLEVIQNEKGKNNEACSIIVQEGSPIIIQCRFPSLLVTGTGSPHVEGNEVAGSLNSGIKLRGRAGGTFQDNSIFSHSHFCVDLGNSRDTTFTSNRLGAPEGRSVKRGKGVINVAFDANGSQAKFIENRISDPPPYSEDAPKRKDPERPAVFVGNDTDVVFQDNEFVNCEIGLRIIGSCPVIADNSFSKMILHGVQILGGSAILTANRFIECYESAVAVSHPLTTPTLQENIIRGFNRGGNGFLITEGAAPVVRSNSFTRISKVAVKIQNASGRFEQNLVDTCSGPSVMVIGESDPEMVENVLTRGDMQGLVVINGAKGVYRGNDISLCLCGVAVLSGSAPTFVDNRVMECVEEGLVLAKACRGSISNNTVQHCRRGMVVTGGSQPDITGNTIAHNNESGILVTDCAPPTITDNVVTDNKGSGIEVSRGGEPTCIDNKIYGNQSYGFDIYGDAFGTYLGNTVENNAIAGVRAAEGAHPVFRDNYIGGGTHSGIVVDSGAHGVYEKNRVMMSKVGISVKDLASFPLILSNTFSQISGVSVEFSKEAKGILRLCTFASVEQGIHIRGMSLPTIEDNRFIDAVCGIHVSGRGTEPTLTKNRISGSEGTGILLEDCCAHVTGNVFSGCKVGITCASVSVIEQNDFSGGGTGVKLIAGSRSKVQENAMVQCGTSGVCIADGACVMVHSNTMVSGAAGVLLCGITGESKVFDNAIRENRHGVRAIHDEGRKGKTLVTQNEIEGSTEAGFCVEERGHVIAVANTVSNGAVGALVLTNGNGTFRENTFVGNRYAVKSMHGGNPVVEECLLKRSDIGIFVTEGGKGRYANNTFEKNTTHLHVDNQGCPTVMNCDLSGSVGCGLILRKGAKGVYTCNKFCNNTLSGIEIETGSDPVVEGNVINNNGEHGVLLCSDAYGHIRNNEIHSNGKAGVSVSQGSRPIIEANDLTQNEWGIVVEKGAGRILSNLLYQNKSGGVCLLNGCDPEVESNNIKNESVGISFGKSKGRISANTVRSCALGFEMYERCAPIIFQNTIMDCAKGARLKGSCFGNMKDNKFVENGIALHVTERSTPQVEGNYFVGSSAEGSAPMNIGILCASGGGSVTKNMFHRLEYGIHTSSVEAQPKIVENAFSLNRVGVSCTEKSRPVLDINEFQGNDDCGARIESDATPKMLRNTFSDEAVGMDFVNGGAGLAEKNTFAHNKVGCRIGGATSAPDVQQNHFVDNTTGLLSHEAARGTVSANFFTRSSDAGVCFMSGGNSKLLRNAFAHHDLGSAGVRCTEGGRGEIHGNLFTHNLIGAHLQKGDCRMSRNLFCAHGRVGVLSTDYGSGEVSSNAFRGNARDVETSNHGQTHFSNNSFDAPHSIWCHKLGGGRFSHNCITGKFVVATEAYPTVENNVIQGLGILFETRGRGNVIGNTFLRQADRAVAGIEIRTEACPDVMDNTFWKTARGVYIHDNASGQFSGNKFQYGKVGMEVGKGGTPEVCEGNVFEGLDKAVVSSGEGSAGTFNQIQVIAAGQVGVVVERDAHPTFTESDLLDCRCAVHVFSGSPEFNDCEIFDNATGVQIDTGMINLRNNRIYSFMEAGSIVKAEGAHIVFDGNSVRHQFSPPANTKRLARAERTDLRRKNGPRDCKKGISDAERRQANLLDHADAVIREVEDLFRAHRLEKPDLSRGTTGPETPQGSALIDKQSAARKSTSAFASAAKASIKRPPSNAPSSPGTTEPETPTNTSSRRETRTAPGAADRRDPRASPLLGRPSPKTKAKRSVSAVVDAIRTPREKGGPSFAEAAKRGSLAPHKRKQTLGRPSASPGGKDYPSSPGDGEVSILLSATDTDKAHLPMVSLSQTDDADQAPDTLEWAPGPTSQMRRTRHREGGGSDAQDLSARVVLPTAQRCEDEVSTADADTPPDSEGSYADEEVEVEVDLTGLLPEARSECSILPFTCNYSSPQQALSLLDQVSVQDGDAWGRWCAAECRIYPTVAYGSAVVPTAGRVAAAEGGGRGARGRAGYIEGVEATPASPSHWQFAHSVEAGLPPVREMQPEPPASPRKRRACRRHIGTVVFGGLPEPKAVNVSSLASACLSAADNRQGVLPELEERAAGILVPTLPPDMVPKPKPPRGGGGDPEAAEWRWNASTRSLRVPRAHHKTAFVARPLPEVDLDRLKLTAPGLVRATRHRLAGLPA